MLPALSHLWEVERGLGTHPFLWSRVLTSLRGRQGLEMPQALPQGSANLPRPASSRLPALLLAGSSV